MESESLVSVSKTLRHMERETSSRMTVGMMMIPVVGMVGPACCERSRRDQDQVSGRRRQHRPDTAPPTSSASSPCLTVPCRRLLPSLSSSILAGS